MRRSKVRENLGTGIFPPRARRYAFGSEPSRNTKPSVRRLRQPISLPCARYWATHQQPREPDRDVVSPLYAICSFYVIGRASSANNEAINASGALN